MKGNIKKIMAAIFLPISILFLPIELIEYAIFELRGKIGRLFSTNLKLDINKKNYLNLGCADMYKDNFINVDYFDNGKIDYGMDLRYPFKIESNSIDGIFSEHTFEHLSHKEVDNALSECYRILKNGAIIRIIVPDLSILIRKYYENDAAWFESWYNLVLDHPSRNNLKKYYTKMFAINFTASYFFHKSCWDLESLEKILSNHGFIDIKQYDYNLGTPELLIDRDEEDRKLVSIYIEGKKGY